MREACKKAPLVVVEEYYNYFSIYESGHREAQMIINLLFFIKVDHKFSAITRLLSISFLSTILLAILFIFLTNFQSLNS